MYCLGLKCWYNFKNDFNGRMDKDAPENNGSLAMG